MIPNNDDAGAYGPVDSRWQSRIDSTDVAILSAGYSGNGIVSGCDVTAQGVPDMTVAVAAGIVKINGTNYNVSANSALAISAADATNPRRDIITVDTSSVIAVVPGSPQANPVKPAIPANKMVLAEVLVPANDTTIGSDQIIDKRVGTLFHPAINVQTGTTYTVAMVDNERIVTLSNAAAITLTLPQDSDVAFPIGTQITFIQIGAGQVTVVAGTGATLNSPGPTNKFRVQWSTVTAIKRAANTWVIMGDLASS